MDRYLGRPITLLIMLACMLFMPVVSHAEIKAGSTNLTIFAGGYTQDHELLLADPYSKADLDTSYSAGFGAGYNFTKHFGVEAVYNHAWARFDRDNDLKRTVKTDLYHLDLLYHLNPDSKCVVYVAAGAGGIYYNPVDENVDKENDIMFNYGVGFKYFMSPAVAFRGDVRGISTPLHNVGEWNNNVLYNIGLVIALGNTEEAKPMVAEPAPAPAPEPAPEPEVVTPPPPPPAPEVKEAGTYVFRNIYFDFDKSTIKPESEPILDEVSDYLKSKPDLKMEIQGHTDSVGTAAYNMKLSERRAEAIKAYLVKDEAIKSDRLTTKGYGLTMPVADNKTAEGRAKNRRVEFKPLD